jgi:quercetin dioxygenase-like cupin family protein
MKLRLLLAASVLAMLSVSGSPPAEEAARVAVADKGPAHHLVYSPEKIEWREGPPSFEPGARMAVLEGDPNAAGVFTMRFRVPDGFRIAPHWHPNVERVTVLSGTLRLGSGDKMSPEATMALGPGSYTSMPPGMRHFAIAEGDTVIQLTSIGPWQINYVNREDDPRLRTRTSR